MLASLICCWDSMSFYKGDLSGAAIDAGPTDSLCGEEVTRLWGGSDPSSDPPCLLFKVGLCLRRY